MVEGLRYVGVGGFIGKLTYSAVHEGHSERGLDWSKAAQCYSGLNVSLNTNVRRASSSWAVERGYPERAVFCMD